MDEETKNPTEEAVEKPAEGKVEEPQEKTAEEKGSSLAALAESNPEAAAILAEHEQKIARLEAENQRQAQVIQLRENTAQVETWLSEGKSVPAMSKLELEFISGLDATQREAYAARADLARILEEMGPPEDYPAFSQVPVPTLPEATGGGEA